jgi:malate synthase
MPDPNQISRQRDDAVSQADLLRVPKGSRTEDGMRVNIRVGVQYLAAWLGGTGCVPLYNLMEDAATAEISRAQLWQWVHHAAKLDDGRKATAELFRELLADELAGLRSSLGDGFDEDRMAEASQMFDDLVTAEVLEPFLTLPAYERLLTLDT